MPKNVRPWQGTVLGVLSYIGLVCMVILIFVVLAGQGFITSVMSTLLEQAQVDVRSMGMALGVFQSVGIFSAVLMAPFAILEYFVAKGLMDGVKWPLYLVVIFSGLSALAGLLAMELVTILFNGFFVYLGVSIWNDPYYNKKA